MWARLLLLTTFAVIFRLTVLRRRREGGDFAEVDVSATFGIALVGVTCILLAFRAGVLPRWWQGLRGLSGRWLALLLVLSLSSSAWSVEPTYSFFRALEVASQTLAIFAVFACVQSFRHAERILLLLAGGTLAMDAYFQATTGGGSNSVGICAVMLFCYGAGQLLAGGLGSRSWTFVYTVLALGLVAFSRSTASWWSGILGIVVAFALTKSKRIVIVCALLLGVGIIGIGLSELQVVIDPHGGMEKLETMHGRTLLWDSYFETILQHPVLGLGYAVGPRVAGVVYQTNAHNSIVSIALSTGCLGVIVYLFAAIGGVREGLWACRLRRPGAAGVSAALAAGSVNSMSISALGDVWAPSSCVLMAMYSFFIVAVLRPRWSVAATPEDAAGAGR